MLLWDGLVITQPPHDLDAERALLGAMLMSGTAIDEVGEVCGTVDFYRPAHQLIAEALVRLRAQGAPTDPVAVADQLRREGTLQRCGGAPRLHTLLASAPAAVTATYHARIVAEHAERRHWIEAADRLRQAASSLGTELDDLRLFARSLNGQGPARSGDRAASRRLVLTPAAHIEPRPVRWGWQDRLPAAHLGLIPGREGIGKSLLLTWLIAQITRGNCRECLRAPRGLCSMPPPRIPGSTPSCRA